MIINENIIKKKGDQQLHEHESNNDEANSPDDDKAKSSNVIKKLPNRKKLVIIAVGDNPLPSHAAFDFIHCRIGMEKKVNWKHYHVMVLIVPTNTPSHKKETMFEACRKAKKINPKLFVCIIDIEASESAVFRSKCFDYGANMVTNDHHSLKQVLNIIGNKGFKGRGQYKCPYCGMQDLTEDELWHHVPLYHVNDTQSGNIQCPICQEDKRKNYLLHLRNHHGPVMRGEIAPEYRDGILTHAFALVVVRRPTDSKFLVVQEAANSGFWLPGGRVEVGETLLEAAIRETKEEAGIDVDIKGVLKVEHSTYAFDERKKAYNRMRVIFYAEPCDEKELPKSVPNYDSAGATFISVDELDDIVLRADEPREYFNSLTQNFYYYPLDILSCWKHDHRSANHPGQYFIQQNGNNNNDDDRDRERGGLLSNNSSANKHIKNGMGVSDAPRESGDHLKPNNRRGKPVMAVQSGLSPESENSETDYSSSYPSYPSNTQDEQPREHHDMIESSDDDEALHPSNSSHEEEEDTLDDDDEEEMVYDEEGDIEDEYKPKRVDRRHTNPEARSPFVRIGPQQQQSQGQHVSVNPLSPSQRNQLPQRMDSLRRGKSDDVISAEHTPSRKKVNPQRDRGAERNQHGKSKPGKPGKTPKGIGNLPPRNKPSMKKGEGQQALISPDQTSRQTITAPQQDNKVPPLAAHAFSNPEIHEPHEANGASKPGMNNNTSTPTTTSPSNGNTNPNPNPPQPSPPTATTQLTYIVAASPMGHYPFSVNVNGGMMPGMYAQPPQYGSLPNMYNYEQPRISNMTGLPMQQMEKTGDQTQQTAEMQYLQQFMQYPQYQGYPAFNGVVQNGQHAPFYVNGQSAPRNSQQNVIYAQAPPPHSIYPIYAPQFAQQQQQQQQADTQSQTQSQQQQQATKDNNKSDVQFTNLHNNQQPKPEPKNSNKPSGVPPINRTSSRHGLKSPESSVKRPKSTKHGKGKKRDKTANIGRATPKSVQEMNFKTDRNGNGNSKKKANQSDSLLRKKKHRRSLSSGVLPDSKLQHHHFNAPDMLQMKSTPPPAPMYSDEINQQALLSFAAD